jgi:hypothetical protein
MKKTQHLILEFGHAWREIFLKTCKRKKNSIKGGLTQKIIYFCDNLSSSYLSFFLNTFIATTYIFIVPSNTITIIN